MWTQARIWPNTYIFWSFGWHPEIIWRLNLPGYYPVVVTQMCSKKGTSLQLGEGQSSEGWQTWQGCVDYAGAQLVGWGWSQRAWCSAPWVGLHLPYKKSEVSWKTNLYIFPDDDWPSESTGIKLHHIINLSKSRKPVYRVQWSFLHICEMLPSQIPAYFSMQQSLQ